MFPSKTVKSILHFESVCYFHDEYKHTQNPRGQKKSLSCRATAVQMQENSPRSNYCFLYFITCSKAQRGLLISCQQEDGEVRETSKVANSRKSNLPVFPAHCYLKSHQHISHILQVLRLISLSQVSVISSHYIATIMTFAYSRGTTLYDSIYLASIHPLCTVLYSHKLWMF